MTKEPKEKATTRTVLMILAAVAVLLLVLGYIARSEWQKAALTRKLDKLTLEQFHDLNDNENRLGAEIKTLRDSLGGALGVIENQNRLNVGLAQQFADLEKQIKKSNNEVDNMDNRALLIECLELFANIQKCAVSFIVWNVCE